MNEVSERVITIVVRDNELRLALVSDVSEDVDVLIAADNPRWSVMMDLLGDRLQDGPIVCTNEAEVNDLIASISKKTDRKTTAGDDTLRVNNDVLRDLRFDLHAAETMEAFDHLSKIRSVPFHHQLNQHPARPGKEGPQSKQSRHRMHGKKK